MNISFSLSASAILALNTSGVLTSDEKQALKNLLYVSSCYLKVQANYGTLNSIEIEFLQNLNQDEKPKKEIRKIKPSPRVGPVAPQTLVDVMTPLDLGSLLGPEVIPELVATPETAETAVPVVVPASTGPQRKYRLDVPNETKCRARRYGSHIPNTKPKVYFEAQCNNKPEGEHNLCKTCQKYFNNKDDKDSHKRREWSGFVCGDIPEHTAVVGGKWFQKKFPKGLPDMPESTIVTTITTPILTIMEEKHIIVEESVAEENEPVKNEEWRPYTHNGVFYAIHIKNNKVYKADMTKEGKDMVILDQYCGVFENGTINAYVDEDEADE